MLVLSLAFFCGISQHPTSPFAPFLAFEKEDHKSRLVAFALMIALTCLGDIRKERDSFFGEVRTDGVADDLIEVAAN